MADKKSSLWEGVKRMKGIKYLILALVCGVALLWLSGITEGEADAEPSAGTVMTAEMDAYREGLEKQLTEILSRVKGAGAVRVIVMLEGGEERIAGQAAADATVGYGTASDRTVVGSRYPAVRGIGVVCSGGGDADVRKELIGLCCAIFDLPSHKVFVASGR